MNYIEMEGVHPDIDWLKRSCSLTKQLSDAADDAERKRIIDKNSPHWGVLKEWLTQLSLGKY